MAFCGQCGFQNPDGARFCGSCGADLTPQEVGNVETLVNESAGTPAQGNEPMAYVPLETPLMESTTPETPETPAPQTTSPTPQPSPSQPEIPTPPAVPPTPQATPAIPQPAPSQPDMPAPPAVPPTPQPVPQPMPQPAPQPAADSVPSNTNTPPPPPQPKQSNTKKTCLGCGCAAGIVLLLAIGGLAWWGYSAYKEHNKDIEEVLKWVDQGHKEYEQNKGNTGDEWGFDEGENIENTEGVDITDDGDEPSGNDGGNAVSPSLDGTSAKELAQQLNVPVVGYNALPKNGMFYRNKDGEIGVMFNISSQRGSSSVGTMEITHWMSGEKIKFNIQSCGNSIYRLDNPKDKDMTGYMFVYEGGKRIMMGDKNEMQELTMN